MKLFVVLALTALTGISHAKFYFEPSFKTCVDLKNKTGYEPTYDTEHSCLKNNGIFVKCKNSDMTDTMLCKNLLEKQVEYWKNKLDVVSDVKVYDHDVIVEQTLKKGIINKNSAKFDLVQAEESTPVVWMGHKAYLKSVNPNYLRGNFTFSQKDTLRFCDSALMGVRVDLDYEIFNKNNEIIKSGNMSFTGKPDSVFNETADEGGYLLYKHPDYTKTDRIPFWRIPFDLPKDLGMTEIEMEALNTLPYAKIKCIYKIKTKFNNMNVMSCEEHENNE